MSAWELIKQDLRYIGRGSLAAGLTIVTGLVFAFIALMALGVGNRLFPGS